MSKLVNEVRTLNLVQDPELRARYLYRLMKSQSEEVRFHLQRYFRAYPLIEEGENFHEELKRSKFPVDTLDDIGD